MTIRFTPIRREIPTHTPRAILDHEIHRLQDEVLLLGSLVEQAMLDAVDSLCQRNFELSRRVYHNDKAVNEKRFAIENAVLVLIATQQPMAHDLRVLAAILEVITELERMGDYAKGVALINLRLSSEPVAIPGRDFTRMANLAVDMLHRALTAFVQEDAAQARQIPLDDDAVDDLYNQVNRDMIASMLADPQAIDSANLLMWVAHNLERMADRVSNLCERTIFIVTGELMELETSDDENKIDI